MGGGRAEDSRLSTESVAGLVATVAKCHGANLTPYDATFLAKCIDARIALTSSAGAPGYSELLQRDSEEVQALLHSLQIGYSEFFRDALSFALLERAVLPALVRQRSEDGASEIRIWSAGCSGGQEAYSVAILLSELAESLDRPVAFRIIASDVSEGALATARRGQYARGALGNVRLRQLERWFSAKGSTYEIVPELRCRVDFSHYDLLDKDSSCPPASIFGGFDLVLCCNVLIYYRGDACNAFLEKVGGCLSPGGYLVTSDSERSIVRKSGGFRAISASASVFRKLDRRG